MTSATAAGRNGRILTFYSYKGGTGRSMALANVAWILASASKRVLMVDWDLEAPGLHRYVHPFLVDKYLTSSLGVINMAHEYQTSVLKQLSGKPQPNNLEPEWFAERADILRYATEISYKFQAEGALHFIPAGMQDVTYAKLVNRFNWQQLFDNLGGYYFFEAVKQQMRSEYDYVLIDSRTGVSDTSGLCTVQLPDEVVVCFTMNTQSLEGASSVALSALQQRMAPDGGTYLRIWPVPTRVELAEKERVDGARERARALFEPVMGHIKLEEREAYWAAVEVLYHPFYAYEEVLSVFGDQPGQTHSMLGAMERLTAYLTDRKVQRFEPIPEQARRSTLASFSRRPLSETNRILASYAAQYEELRRTLKSGDGRTRKMTELVFRAQAVADQVDAPAILNLFASNQDGARLMAVALAQASPSIEFLSLALEGIREPRSPFEQYHALVLAKAMVENASGTERRQLMEAIQNQMGKYIRQSDPSRWLLAEDLIGTLTAGEPGGRAAPENEWIQFAPKPRPLEQGERWNVFLDYRSAHRSWVLSLYDVLRNLGYEVFLDQYVLTAGDDVMHALESALNASQAVVLVLSSEDSEWVIRRIDKLDFRASRKKNFRVVPVRLDRRPFPRFASATVVLDFSDYPDGPNGGELLRLTYALNGQPLSAEAALFAVEQDEAARAARIRIGAAIRNGNPERLMQLFEQGGLVWQASPVLGCNAAEGLIRLARYSEATVLLDKLEEQFPKAIRPKQLRALALTRRGELPEAQEILGELYERGARDPETLGTYAQTWRHRYLQSGDQNDLRQARDLYIEAYEAAPDDYYAGVNAATTSVLLDDLSFASGYAERLQALLGTDPHPGDYWKTTAAAELCLIRKDYDQAAKLYDSAVAMARSQAGSHQTTWTQACRLMAKLQPLPRDRDMIRAAFAHLPDCDKL